MPTISIYIPEKLKDQLAKVSEEEMRSVSNLVTIILERGLQEIAADHSWLTNHETLSEWKSI